MKLNKLEALLLQTDRATRCVSQNLASCRNNLTNPQQIAVMERVTIDRLVVNSHDLSIVV